MSIRSNNRSAIVEISAHHTIMLLTPRLVHSPSGRALISTVHTDSFLHLADRSRLSPFISSDPSSSPSSVILLPSPSSS
eukprot:m.11219 g.11219  ORF g.11219 m.11219 type:complete len:79 (-) comp6423_c0_seq1:80-316(-)